MVPKTGFSNWHDWITVVIGLYAVTQCVGWEKGRSIFLLNWYDEANQGAGSREL